MEENNFDILITENLDATTIVQTQCLSDKLLTTLALDNIPLPRAKYWNCLFWMEISRHQKLSENFIKQFKDYVDWDCIVKYQKLSENFIREFKDYVDWELISIFQKLSENFIREFKDYVDWDCISTYQKLSEDFIEEFKHKLGDVYNESWLYKDKEFLKKQVIETGLFECYDDYFIAYKGVRGDRYSGRNFQYQYLKGEIYEAHCDCTENDGGSFGLSVSTKNNALEYAEPLLLQVKINYIDVGVVFKHGLIRAKKIEILN